MKVPISLRVEIPGQSDAVIAPGDALDLGEHGVVVWYADEDAKAYRLSQKKRQREIRAVIEFTRGPLPD